jgi:hypothetical protein
LLERLKRWLQARGLTPNETKTRLLDAHKDAFKFLGFEVSWRRGKNKRGYPHVEPHAKSQAKLRDKLQGKAQPLDPLASGGGSSQRNQPAAQRLGGLLSLAPTARESSTG